MDVDPLASRLATRLRVPILVIGAASALVTTAKLMIPSMPDPVVIATAITVSLLAAALFLCAMFDIRFQKSLSALNAERRRQARVLGWHARLLGIGLPIGERAFFALGLVLATLAMVAFNVLGQELAASLGLSGFLLVGVAQIALMVRGYPTDRFFEPFE